MFLPKRVSKALRPLAHQLRLRLRLLLHRRRLSQWRKDGRPIVAIGQIEYFGDIVASEPIARYLRSRHPDARLIWLCRKPFAVLLEGNPALDNVVPVACLGEWQAMVAKKWFDVAYDLHFEGWKCHSCQIPIHKPDVSEHVTVENYYFKGCLLKATCLGAGLPVLDNAPVLNIPATAVHEVNALSLPERYVVFHAASAQDSRNWEVEKWIGLGKWLNNAGYEVVEIGNKPLVIGSGDVRGISACGKASLMASAEIIRRARLFVGIDSGPAHLAHAVGTPGIIILGRYRHFASYTPYSNGYGDGTLATLLRDKGPAAQVPLEAAIAAAMDRLDMKTAPQVEDGSPSNIGRSH